MTGAAALTPENANANSTANGRINIPLAVLPFPTTFVPNSCILFDMAITHGTGSNSG
jgi:hypothetical protein